MTDAVNAVLHQYPQASQPVGYGLGRANDAPNPRLAERFHGFCRYPCGLWWYDRSQNPAGSWHPCSETSSRPLTRCHGPERQLIMAISPTAPRPAFNVLLRACSSPCRPCEVPPASVRQTNGKFTPSYSNVLHRHMARCHALFRMIPRSRRSFMLDTLLSDADIR